MDIFQIIPLLIIIPMLAFILSNISTSYIARLMKKKGIIGVDVHKPHKPKIPEACGLAIMLTVIPCLFLALFFDNSLWLKVLALTLTSSFVGITGLLDDLRKLDAVTKTLLTFLAIVPIIFLKVYVPKPMLPFIGTTRLTLVYLAIMPFAIAVTSNAVNMIDVFNGVMPLSMIFSFTALLVSSIIKSINKGFDLFAIYASAVMLATLLGYFRYNKYPAKVFNGDVGSLFVGAYFGALAIIGRLEIVAMTAMMPMIMNGFNIITSIKGLKERHEIIRPTIVKSNGLIYANRAKEAPMTLAHLFTLKSPLTEKELVESYIVLSLFSCILAIIMAILTYCI